MKYYLIVVLVFMNFLSASELNVGITTQYEKDMSRQQMLRNGKHLSKRYEDALNKLQNWEIKKEELIEAYRKKYSHQDKSFGTGNEYGQMRAKKRRQEYYNSLNKQENQINERVIESQIKLQNLKNEFLLKFAVPLTAEEMNGGKAPLIKDKSEKIQMLNGYIEESNAWQRCRDRVFQFDKVKVVANSIEVLFPEANLTQASINQRSEQNIENMQKHLEKFQDIDEAYWQKYGISITDRQKAKIILRGIERELNNIK